MSSVHQALRGETETTTPITPRSLRPPPPPPLPPRPAAGRLWAFICGPAGGSQVPAIFPDPCALPSGGGGGSSRLGFASASPLAPTPRGQTVRPGVREDGDPRVHRLFLGFRGGEHCGDWQRARVGSGGRQRAERGPCGRRAALAPARLGALRVRTGEPAPGR